MYDIEIANEQSLVEIAEDFLLEVVRQTLADEKVQRAEISTAHGRQAAIPDLNRPGPDTAWVTPAGPRAPPKIRQGVAAS